VRIPGSDWATLAEVAECGPPLRWVSDNLLGPGKPGRKRRPAGGASDVRSGAEKRRKNRRETASAGGRASLGMGDLASARTDQVRLIAIGQLIGAWKGSIAAINSP
jgi:hypothetical protein